jgi:hypothetical protein
MPSNYIPWGGPGPQEKQRRCFEGALRKISHVAVGIQERSILPVERGPLWQRIVFTALYDLSLSRVPGMDKKFWADDRCDACGVCLRGITIRRSF